MNDEFGPDHFYSDHHGWCHTICVLFSPTPRTCVFNDHRGGRTVSLYFFLSKKKELGINQVVAQEGWQILTYWTCKCWALIWCEQLLQYSASVSLLIVVHNLVPHFAWQRWWIQRRIFFIYSLWVGALLTLCLSVGYIRIPFYPSATAFCEGIWCLLSSLNCLENKEINMWVSTWVV